MTHRDHPHAPNDFDAPDARRGGIFGGPPSRVRRDGTERVGPGFSMRRRGDDLFVAFPPRLLPRFPEAFPHARWHEWRARWSVPRDDGDAFARWVGQVTDEARAVVARKAAPVRTPEEARAQGSLFEAVVDVRAARHARDALVELADGAPDTRDAQRRKDALDAIYLQAERLEPVGYRSAGPDAPTGVGGARRAGRRSVDDERLAVLIETDAGRAWRSRPSWGTGS